jgi:hypothetical protein
MSIMNKPCLRDGGEDTGRRGKCKPGDYYPVAQNAFLFSAILSAGLLMIPALDLP